MKIKFLIIALLIGIKSIIISADINPNWLYHNFGVQLKIGLHKFNKRHLYIKLYYGESVVRGYNLANILPKDSVVKISYSNGRIYYNGLLYEKISFNKLDVITLIGISYDGKNYKKYRGNFDFIPYKNKIIPVNRIMSEEYLYSVVPSEIGNSFPDEAIKAQAVAARTYLFYNLENKKFDKFDLLDDTSSQMYLGYEKENPKINKLINETVNEIITYDNRPINALYHSSSGGMTANNEEVWNGTAMPYLRAVDDKDNSKNSPRSSWSYTLSKWKIESIFNVINPKEIICYEKSGIRVKKVKIKGDNSVIVPGNEFRRRIGYTRVFSTVFNIQKRGNSFVITGKGSGHGVGMSQWGAYGLSKNGSNYKEILKYYYTGVDIKKIANFEKYAIMGR